MSKPDESSDDIPPVTHDHIECDGDCGKSCPPLRCARCRSTYYCSKSCQKKHWKESHKKMCVEVDTARRAMAGIGDVSCLPSKESINSTCAICLSDTITQPIVLSTCKHSFCFKCLRDYHTVLMATQMSGDTFACPCCRTESPSADDVVYESAMMHAIGASQQRDKDPGESDRLCQVALEEIQRVIDDSNNFSIRPRFLKMWIMSIAKRPEAEMKEATTDLTNFGISVSQRIKECLAAGDKAQVKRITDEITAFRDNNMNPLILMQTAKNREDTGDWAGARDAYNEILVLLHRTPHLLLQEGKLVPISSIGLSRCYYEEGQFDKAIEELLNGIVYSPLKRHRCLSGAHKYVALSYAAKGELETARKFIARGILYEAPWDDENTKENMKIWRDLHTSN
jgi:hypothetical protein